MAQPLKPPGTATCYNLSYAGSWSYKITAPYAHLPLCLARICDSTQWVLCHYQRPSQVWLVLHAFDPRDIDEYLSDNEEDLRILGWENNDAKNGVSLYFDLQFQERDDLVDWCRHVLDARVKRGNTLLSSLDMIQIFQDHPAPRSISPPATPSYPCLGPRDPLAAMHGQNIAILSMHRDPRIAARYATTATLRPETILSSASLRKAMENGLKIRKRVPLQLPSPSTQLQSQSEKVRKGLDEQAPMGSTQTTLFGPPPKAWQQRQDVTNGNVSLGALIDTCAPASAMSEVSRSRKHWAEEWDSGARPPKRRKKSKKAQSLEHTATSENQQATQSTPLCCQSIVSVPKAAEHRLSLFVSAKSTKANGIEQPVEDLLVIKKPTSNDERPQMVVDIADVSQVDATPEREVLLELQPCNPGHPISIAPSPKGTCIIDLGEVSNPSSQDDAVLGRSFIHEERKHVENREASLGSGLSLLPTKDAYASQESEGHCDSNQLNQTATDVEQGKLVPLDAPSTGLERPKEQPGLVSGDESVRSENSRLEPLSTSNTGVSEATEMPPRFPEGPVCLVTPETRGERSSQPELSPSAASFDESLTGMLARAESDPRVPPSPLLVQCIHLLKVQQSMIAETRAEVAALRDEVKDLRRRARQ